MRWNPIAFASSVLTVKRNRALRPGGKVELVDFDFILYSDDNTVSEDNQLTKFLELLIGAAKTLGIDMSKATQYEDLLRDAGFEDIKTVVYKLPMGKFLEGARLSM